MYFCVLVKFLRLFGGDYFYLGIVVGKFEGEREVMLGFVDLMWDDYIEKDRSCGVYFI